MPLSFCGLRLNKTYIMRYVLCMTSPDLNGAHLWLLYLRAFSKAFGDQLDRDQGRASRCGIYSLGVVVWLMMYQRLNSKRTLSSTVHWLARNAAQLKPFNDCKRVRAASISTNTGGAIIDHMPPRERRLVAVQK